MTFLSVLLLLWGVSLSNASGRLRSFHLINEQQMSINEARKSCSSDYTDLVTIYDEEENMELVEFLKKSKLSTGWIGASSCKWSNGDSVKFTNISSNFTEENCCGAVNTDGRWECLNCSSTKIFFMCYDQATVGSCINGSYINGFCINRSCIDGSCINGSCINGSCINGFCIYESCINESCINGSCINRSCINEYFINESLIDGSCINGSCSNGSLNYRQQSYSYSLIRENKSWIEAQLYCRKNHSDLVSIRTEEENERVKEAANVSDSFWIGLQYNHSIEWIDDGRSNYTPKTKSRECFTLLSVHGFWVKSNGKGCSALCHKRFIYVSRDIKSWEEALDYCNSHYSGLMRIESESDQKEVQRELKRQNISGPVWVGLRKSRLFEFWIWTNGLIVGPWTNWKDGSKPGLVSQHCGAVEEVDGRYIWTDKDCRSEFTFLCEMK